MINQRLVDLSQSCPLNPSRNHYVSEVTCWYNEVVVSETNRSEKIYTNIKLQDRLIPYFIVLGRGNNHYRYSVNMEIVNKLLSYLIC